MLMLLVAVTTFAQITVGSVYSIQNKNTGNAIKQDANNELATVEANTGDNAQLWIVEEGAEGTYMLRNLASGRYAQYVNANYTHWYTDYVTTGFYVGETEAATAEAPAYYYISFSAIADVKTASYSVMHQSNGYVVRWEQTNNSSQWSFVEVENVDVATISNEWKNMTTTKASAVAEIEALAKLNVLFPESAAFVERINAVTATSSDNSDLVDAGNRIKAIVTEYKQNADGKDVTFTNTHTDVRSGLRITSSGGNAYGIAQGNVNDDNAIWTLKLQDNGYFKMYNFMSNKYLNNPGTAALADESAAANYKFITTDDNKTALVNSGDNMLHQANYWGPTNYTLLSWYDLNDPASIWTVDLEPIAITREDYDAAYTALESLPYAIQQAYGLVTDATNYYSNYLSTQEGSYAALLDNDVTSYFHSSYAEADLAEDIPAHYIQANLGVGNSVDEFYFYMVPRSGNGNNRPVNITVYGSNDDVDYTEIAQVATTLDGSMTPYLSDKLGTDGTNYQYIRLTVTSTNTSTKFFTLSELYFFPATNDVTSLVDTYNTFKTTSITDENINTLATTLVNAESVLALSNIKKEIAALISANENNHATTPTLGQYTTAAYDALVAAYNADDATQESLEAAIAAFNKAKNVPVYFIRSAHNGYAAGSAIYYDGAWKWKTANKYDKQMWMTIPAYAQENIPVVDAYDSEGTSYEICDYLTSTVMRDKSVQIVKINGLDNAYNLQYNANASSTDAAQHAKDNGQLVNWKPATSTDALASAWYIDYLGTSYELDQLTDETLAALSPALLALQNAYNAKAFYADAEIGEGLGEYTGSKEAIVAALPAAEEIIAMNLAEQAKLDVSTINEATTALNEAEVPQINLPVEGKYYRIKGACEDVLPGYYLSSNDNPDGGRIACVENADASTIFYFKDGKLLSYKSGLYLALDKDNWKYSSVDGTTPASTVTFAGSPRVAGAYTVLSDDRYLHYTSTDYHGGVWTVQVDRCSTDTDSKHDWTLEEVTELPVAVSAAGYATLYAPVALEVADDVKAYTVTINGEWATLNVIENGVIPANVGVVIAGADGKAAVEDTYNFTITTSEPFAGENALDGTVAAAHVTKDAYVLSYIDTDEDGVKDEVGFYIATKNQAENTAFINNSHKAFLATPVVEGVASYSFRFGEGTTGISEVKGESGNVKGIYDLTGRRVEAITAPGIYVVGGKKVLVK